MILSVAADTDKESRYVFKKLMQPVTARLCNNRLTRPAPQDRSNKSKTWLFHQCLDILHISYPYRELTRFHIPPHFNNLFWLRSSENLKTRWI
jgi:hypothetical protein